MLVCGASSPNDGSFFFNSEYTEAVLKLHQCFKRSFQKYIPKEHNSDDDDFTTSKDRRGKKGKNKCPYNLDAIVSL